MPIDRARAGEMEKGELTVESVWERVEVNITHFRGEMYGYPGIKWLVANITMTVISVYLCVMAGENHCRSVRTSPLHLSIESSYWSGCVIQSYYKKSTSANQSLFCWIAVPYSDRLRPQPVYYVSVSAAADECCCH